MRSPPPLDPSTDDTHALLGVLQQIPHRPRPLAHPANWDLALRSVADYVLQAHGWMARVATRFEPYPKPFQKIEIKSQDGTRLSAWLGSHVPEGTPERRRKRAPVETREGILIVPGMFSSKNNRIHKARALKIFREWGYHVLVMELRGFGESGRVHNTAGWKEAQDVASAVEAFRRLVPLHKLHIYSESMGASAALIAAAQAARQGQRLIDGGLLAVSPYADAKAQAQHLSRRSLTDPEFFMVRWFLMTLLRLGGQKHPDFVSYMAAAARHAGITPDELYRRSSPSRYVREINVPTIILHSTDDPVVPTDQGAEFERLLAERRNPTVWRLPWGSHCLYELVDPDWFWTLLREFFDFYCLLPKRI